MKSEFQFIQHIKEKYSLGKIGDDCAVLPQNDDFDLVVTADLLIEDIDFRLEWITPELLGHKALAVSLSDIAAMGATPKWAMLSLGVPEKLWNDTFLDGFYSGWHSLASIYDVELVGGDISKTPDKIVIDSMVGGEVPKGTAVLRSGAKTGDAIYVTGFLGAAAGGLKLLQSGRTPGQNTEPWEATLFAGQLKPLPQIPTGIDIQNNRLANCMIDISDGLSSDLKHLCDASGVGARIIAEMIPVEPSLLNIVSTRDELLDLALNGGEDFELLFTSPEHNLSELATGTSDNDEHILFTKLGEITADAGNIELVRNGQVEMLAPKGFRHF